MGARANISAGMFLNAAFNTGRNLINPLFIAGISFLFIRSGLAADLQAINKVSALINALLVFSGWGLKDYLMKEGAGPHHEFMNSWHRAFYSKLLVLPPLLALSFVFPTEYVAFIALMALLRTINALYEPLVLIHKRNFLFFMVDLLLAAALVTLIACHIICSYRAFFYVLVLSEILKSLLNLLVFRLPASPLVPLTELLKFLKQTRLYFLLVLLSFFQSRADLYLLGFLFNPAGLNEYQLLSSLISLSQLMLAAFVISYSKLVYRNIGRSAAAFRKLLLAAGALIAVAASAAIYVILNHLYGFTFHLPGAAVVSVNVIAFAWTLFEMYEYTRRQWLNKTLWFVFISGLVNTGLCLVLIPKLNITGALLSNTFSLMLLGAMMMGRRVSLSHAE